MKRMWKYAGGALVVALCVATTPVEGQRGIGQRGVGPRGGAGPFMGQSIGVALENQEALELNQDQVRELQGMQAVLDQDLTPLMEEMKALREGIQSGDLDRDEGFRQMQALRGQLLTASAPLQGRIQEILTVEQHNRLQPLVRKERPGLGRGQGQGIGPRNQPARSGLRAQRNGLRGRVGIGSRWNAKGRVPAMAPRGRFNRGGSPAYRRPFLQRRGIGGGGADTIPGGVGII